ncbi:MAG: Nif3-like dinuclear metal center hexameric protein [Caldicoprobacterales bacterium]|nr:Nif3-like dinuclear metal center hexameric protein [Clostridiales bacterium]
MSYKVKDIIRLMEEIAPPALAESWDNTGLLVGSKEASVNRILVTLDVTSAVIGEAAGMGVDLIICHHPIIFNSIKEVNDSSLPGSWILELLQAGISVYAAHTNFDKAEGGSDDALAEQLGLVDIRPLTWEPAKEGVTASHWNGRQPSFGRIGRLPGKLTLEAYLRQIEQALNAGRIDFIGDPKKDIQIVACCAGAGGDFIGNALDAGADLFVTGEAKYHELLPVSESSMAAAILGHDTSEYPAVTALKQSLQNRIHALQYKIEVIQSEDCGNIFRRLRE